MDNRAKLFTFRMKSSTRKMLEQLSAESGLGLGITVELAIRENFRRDQLLAEHELEWSKKGLLAEPEVVALIG